MTIDRPAAAEAIADIAQSQARSASLYAYARFAPYLLLTGIMWLTADIAFQFAPAVRPWVWPVVSLACMPLYIGIGVRQATGRVREPGASPFDRRFWRAMATWALAIAFVSATSVVFAPIHGVQVHSFAGLLAGATYAIAGLWLGSRIFGVGLAIGVLTMLVHLYGGAYYTLYMGLVGGGGMILAALWLRRV
jgi:hypothetical protein